MSYLALVLYILLFFLTVLFLKRKRRFFAQFLSLAFLTATDAHFYYKNILVKALADDAYWDWPGGSPVMLGVPGKVDLDNYTVFEHFSAHHYIYCYVVFFTMLSAFHFGGRLFDYLKERVGQSKHAVMD